MALNIEQFRYGAGKGAAIAPPDQATSHRTGCEFSVTPKLLAWATMEGNSIIRGAMRSEKWWDSVAADGAGMRVIAAFFGPYAPDALASYGSVFSHDFKRFERLTKLATSSDGTDARSGDWAVHQSV